MAKYIEPGSFRAHAFAEAAKRLSPISWEVDYSNRCSNSYTAEFMSSAEGPLQFGMKHHRHEYAVFKKRKSVLTAVQQKLYLDVSVPCRKCPACLRARSALWSNRAMRECKMSVRTWFCTYTLAPHHRLRAAIMARHKYGDESFVSIYKIISVWYTHYLMRIRKQSGAKLRFFLAVEAHKDGFPHLHALIHEVEEIGATKRILQGQWPYGFTSIKLADPASARYVTKYLAKSLLVRIRASLGYGIGHNPTVSEPQFSTNPLRAAKENVNLDLLPF